MVHIDRYMAELMDLLRRQYGSRLIYVGLQGSYLRAEATDDSDIDVMVVIDSLSVSDLDQYRAIIQSMDHSEKSCGFICSKADLSNWNPLEICNLVNGTKDYYGVLRELVPAYTLEDIRNFVKLSLNNLYHEICHRYIHADMSKSVDRLPGTYKGVFFILQNLYVLRHGEFIATKADLLPLLTGMDHAVLQRAMEMNCGVAHDFRQSFELLFAWCQDTLASL